LFGVSPSLLLVFVSSKRETLLANAILPANAGDGKGGGVRPTQFPAATKAERQAVAVEASTPVDELP
jgi:hypothetical protein